FRSIGTADSGRWTLFASPAGVDTVGVLPDDTVGVLPDIGGCRPPRRRWVGRQGRGAFQRNTVPPFGPSVMRHVPPACSARAAILARPLRRWQSAGMPTPSSVTARTTS